MGDLGREREGAYVPKAKSSWLSLKIQSLRVLHLSSLPNQAIISNVKDSVNVELPAYIQKLNAIAKIRELLIARRIASRKILITIKNVMISKITSLTLPILIL